MSKSKFNHHFKLLYSKTREVHFRAAHSHMAESWRVFHITQSNFFSWLINCPEILQRDLSVTDCIHPLLWPEDAGSFKRINRGKVLPAWCRKQWSLPRICSKEVLYTCSSTCHVHNFDSLSKSLQVQPSGSEHIVGIHFPKVPLSGSWNTSTQEFTGWEEHQLVVLFSWVNIPLLTSRRSE